MQCIDNASIHALREQMVQAGCVFDYSIYIVPMATVTEVEHKVVLSALFTQIQAEQECHWRSLIAHSPEYANKVCPDLGVNLTLASAQVLDARQITLLCQRTTESALFRAYTDPPYGTRWSSAQAEYAFATWLDQLGLIAEDNISVLDWVGDPDVQPERSTWSNYFNEGKDWWGIWCLTVWNPARRTLAVLAASTTD